MRNQILLPVRLGGSGDLGMILDTGADPSGIDLGLALEQQAVDTTISGEAEGVGTGRTSIYPATLRDLAVGDLTVDSLPALAFDLSALSRRFGRPLHGVLGYSFLRDRVVQVDYAAGVVRVCTGPGPMPLATGIPQVRIPLRLAEGDVIPLIDVIHVNGRRTTVSLDTGSSLGLELFADAVRELRLEAARDGGRADSVFGVRGGAERLVGRVDSLRIGGIPLPPEPVSFSSREGGSQERRGNLGNRALAGLVLTLDYRQGWIVLERPAPPHREPDGH